MEEKNKKKIETMSRNNHIFMPEDHMDELYNSRNSVIKFIFNNKLIEINKLLPPKQSLKILDAGCGEGHLIERLYNENNHNQYYGGDITDVAIKKAKKRCPYAKITKEDLIKLGYDDDFFDIVICTDTIEHLRDYKRAIEEMERVLKKGGILIIHFPNEVLWTFGRFILRRKPIKVIDHVNSFTPKKMRKVIKMKELPKRNLPFRFLPFFVSLGSITRFEK